MIHFMAKNAILGDGSLFNDRVKLVALQYKSVSLEYVEYKKKLFLESGVEYKTIRDSDEYSGYKDDYSIKCLNIGGIPREQLNLGVEYNIAEILKTLTEFDLFLWYLDDGSWHKTRNTMHLYCNSLTLEQTNILADRINELYGIRPKLRIDRKTDGREFNYLYYPRKLVNILHPIYKEFIENAELECMIYKVGGADYIDKKALR